MSYSVLLLIFLATVAERPSDATVVEQGRVASKNQLIAPLAPERDHPHPRVVIKVDEDDLSSASGAKKILVIHYRAAPPPKLGFNDDVIAIAFREGEKYKIAEVLQSDAGVVDGELNSENDFEEEFISINNLRFLYVRDRISGSGGIVEHRVYTISGAASLVTIPFADLRKPKLLNAREELRNAHYKFNGGGFDFEAGIYEPHDPECCPANGSYHAYLKLEGGFQQNTDAHSSAPNLKFVVINDWRNKD